MVERGVDHVLLTGQSDLTFAVVAELAQRGRERRARRATAERPSLPGVTVVGEARRRRRSRSTCSSQRRFGNSRLDRVRAETGRELDEVVASAVDAARRARRWSSAAT